MDTKQPEALRLAPCPFCGGGARRTTVGTNAWFGTGCDGDQSCPAHLRALTHKTQAEADAAWNRRTPPAAAELLRLRTGYNAARLEIESLQTRIKELEGQLDAVGAGGVEPLRKRECLHKIAEPDHFRGATQMVPPDHQALTDTQMHKEFAALRERISDARIGRACSRCEGGTYQADNNGYSQFHRCNKCHYVPMWGEDGREFGATAAPKGGAHGQPT